MAHSVPDETKVRFVMKFKFLCGPDRCCAALAEAQLEKRWQGYLIWLLLLPFALAAFLAIGKAGDAFFAGQTTVAADLCAILVVTFLSSVMACVYTSLSGKDPSKNKSVEVKSDEATDASARPSSLNGAVFFLACSLLAGSFQVLYLISYRWFGNFWWLVPALTSIAFSAAMIMVQSKILKQIFPASPLADESMSRRLYEIADQAGFPLVELLHLDSGINMDDKPLFVATIQDRPRVYFTSTVLDNLNSDEISVAFAHELGHAKMNHVFSKLILKYLLVLGKWFIAAQIVSALCGGVSGAFSLLTLLYAVDAVTGAIIPAIEGMYSRYCEKQADLFALELTGDVESFVTAFERLYDVVPGIKARHALIGIYATHPGLDKRIGYARAWKTASRNWEGV